MFTHQQKFDHFQIHTLKDDKGNLLEIVPERGAIISRFEIAGQEIFYLDRETLNDSSKNVRGGNPVLFPICGPLKGGNCEINGNTYSMKQHGFARNLAWEVVAAQVEEHQASISLELKTSDITLAQYPFEFLVRLTYKITSNALIIEQRYQNLSKEKMPFYAGFHPYFTASEKSAVQLYVQADEYDNFLTGKNESVKKVINFDEAPEVNGAFHNVKESRVKFSNFGLGKAIEITFEPPYRHVVIWGLKDKPFICVEPWMGLNNSLNTGESVVYLDAGSSLETLVAFNIV
ncbi:MAG: aldose epimerase [Acidobacteria bacterium]|nr:aldose epimerase [Acidobacteriota bacterium]